MRYADPDRKGEKMKILGKAEETLLEILHASPQYFFPVSLNGDWDRLYALDGTKLCLALSEKPFTYSCGYTFACGPVWYVKAVFGSPRSASDFMHSEKAGVPYTEDGSASSIEIYITEAEIKLLRKTVFADDTSEFWRLTDGRTADAESAASACDTSPEMPEIPV